MAKIKNVRGWMRFSFITGTVFGFLCGIVLLTILVSYRMDKKSMVIKQMQNTIDDRNTKLEKLEKSLDAINNMQYILKDIEILLNYEGNELDKLEVMVFKTRKINKITYKAVKPPCGY